MTSTNQQSTSKNDRVCVRLRNAREERNIPIDMMARMIRISPSYIEAIEGCDFDALPAGKIYKKRFIESYAKALEMDPAPLLDQLMDEELNDVSVEGPTHPRQSMRRHWFGNVPQLLRIFGGLCVLLAVVAYLGWQINRILEPPPLVIYSPEDGHISEEANILIQGETDKEVEIFINGTLVNNDEQGFFDERIDLSEGVNTITVTARKKHGKETSETFHVVMKESPHISYEQ